MSLELTNEEGADVVSSLKRRRLLDRLAHFLAQGRAMLGFAPYRSPILQFALGQPVSERGFKARLNGSVIFLRPARVGAAFADLRARDDSGNPATPEVIRDGLEKDAQRFSCRHAVGTPHGRIDVVVWMRAAEDLDEPQFAAFRTDGLAKVAAARTVVNGDRVTAEIPGPAGPLHLEVNVRARARLRLDGADPERRRGILNLNGVDEGKELPP